MPIANITEVYLEVARIINDANIVTPRPPLIIKGIEHPSLDKVEEWLALELLLENYTPSRRIQHEETIDFQLTCFTLESSARADNKFVRHYELATLYKNLLHQRDYMINTTCIRFKECKIAYLDLRTSTFTAQAISTGGTPPLQTQSAVILIEANIITNKE